MKDFGCWVEFQVLKGCDRRFTPSFVKIPWNSKHVICELFPRNQEVDIWFGVKFLRLFEIQLQIWKLHMEIQDFV